MSHHKQMRKVAPRPKKTKKKQKKEKRHGVGQGKGGGRPKGTKTKIVHGRVVAVPSNKSLVDHMESFSTPTRGSPIQVGGQGKCPGEHIRRIPRGLI